MSRTRWTWNRNASWVVGWGGMIEQTRKDMLFQFLDSLEETHTVRPGITESTLLTVTEFKTFAALVLQLLEIEPPELKP